MRRLLVVAALLFVSSASAGERQRLDVFWGLVGSYPQERELNPYELTRDDPTLDVGALLYAIRRELKTPVEIARESGIPREDVERKLRQLEHAGLVQRDEGRFLVAFPFWDLPLRDEINSLGQELADRAVEILDEELPGLRSAFEESTLPAQGYAWEEVSLTIVGGLLLDTGVNDRGLRQWRVFDPQRDTPTRPGGYRYWYRAVEGGWGQFWKFGHNLVRGDGSETCFGLFYGQKRGRRMEWAKVLDVHEELTRRIILPLVAEGRLDRATLAKRTGIEAEKLEGVLERMKDAGVIELTETAVEPGFPVLSREDGRLLLGKVDQVCDRIITEAYAPLLPKIRQTWRRIAPRSWKIENIDRWFVRDVYDRPYNLVLDRLIRSGILPPPPVRPPFLYWGLRGRFDIV